MRRGSAARSRLAMKGVVKRGTLMSR